MEGFRVIAVTKKGEDALRQIANKKASYIERIAGGTEKVIKEKPYTLEMRPSKKVLTIINNTNIDLRAGLIIPTMNKMNGCTIHVDYEVEFV